MKKSSVIALALISMALNYVYADCPQLNEHFEYKPSYNRYKLKAEFNTGDIHWTTYTIGHPLYSGERLMCMKLAKVTAYKEFTDLSMDFDEDETKPVKIEPIGIGSYSSIECEYTSPNDDRIITLKSNVGTFALTSFGWEKPYFSLIQSNTPATRHLLSSKCIVDNLLIPPKTCGFVTVAS